MNEHLRETFRGIFIGVSAVGVPFLVVLFLKMVRDLWLIHKTTRNGD